MNISFEKYQGAGNDFILIDNRKLFFKKNTSLISTLCNRNYGIGADGLLFLETADGYDFRMDFFNPDGSHAEMCGNGARCITAFARQLGIINKKALFLAGDGPHEGEIISGNTDTDVVRISIQNPEIMQKHPDHFVINTGTPHYVVFPENEPTLEELYGMAINIRFSEAFSASGINVNFVWSKRDHILVSTYERGVENFTLSCGTGVTASALAAFLKGFDKNPVTVLTAGGKLKVGFQNRGEHFEKVWLEGNATRVFSGSIIV